MKGIIGFIGILLTLPNGPMGSYDISPVGFSQPVSIITQGFTNQDSNVENQNSAIIIPDSALKNRDSDIEYQQSDVKNPESILKSEGSDLKTPVSHSSLSTRSFIAKKPALFSDLIDSIYNSMTTEERVGQLFMIRAHSNLGPEHVKSVQAQIKKYHVGGLCFFQGTPGGHAELINTYQQLSRIPLLVAMDAEWACHLADASRSG